jgi:hypothetical protein
VGVCTDDDCSDDSHHHHEAEHDPLHCAICKSVTVLASGLDRATEISTATTVESFAPFSDSQFERESSAPRSARAPPADRI